MASHNAQCLAATTEPHQSGLGVWMQAKHLLNSSSSVTNTREAI